MTIQIITASAGSGKTTKLSKVLDEAIASKHVRPEAIIATTFTRHAAAELIERARSRLLASTLPREAHQLLAARIGTVNSVCGALVTDFAFELGMSPSLRVLDEAASEIELKRSLASVVSMEAASELYRFSHVLEEKFDWQREVRKIVDGARANGIDADALVVCAARSKASLDACLGPCEESAEYCNEALREALEVALEAFASSTDETGVTLKYVQLLRDSYRDLKAGRLKWGEWAKLTNVKPGKKSAALSEPVATAAARHIAHPVMRQQMHRLTDVLFDVAAKGLRAYREYKQQIGVIDFLDQESLALDLLRRPDVREALRDQIDLVLIDEFQDTSPLQLAIFLELAGLARESVWVGDQKQAIYGFRGTDPALMDAMIESLTSTSTDPELVAKAVSAIGKPSQLHSLDTSYRSRPELVDVTSELFAVAFEKHGIPAARTKLTAALAKADEPSGLGSILEYWPLQIEGVMSKVKLAAAAAAGVQDLVGRAPRVRDRQTGQARPATIADIAVLCRTNEQCQLIADQLAALGIPAIVPRLGLFATAEGHLVHAALRLYIDGRDSLAAAQIARLISYAGETDSFFSDAIAQPHGKAFEADPIVAAIKALRDTSPDLDPGAAVGRLIDAANLRELCASWGNAPQRTANLDALRAHAMAYVGQSESRREATTLTGLLRYFDTLESAGFGWQETSTDEQALLAGADAVTISTWHAAKGREWPITILFGLESLREPQAWGFHVESDATSFDIAEPLAGRWLRFWPNPYATSNQGGPVKVAYAHSREFASVKARAENEALRLLYVGWTRARDRLIFAAKEEKLLDGLVGAMSKLVPGSITVPSGEAPGNVSVTWGGRELVIHVQPCQAAPATPGSIEPGEVAATAPAGAYVPARLAPSSAAEVPITIGEPVSIGERIRVTGDPDMGAVGDAVHAFFAIDRIEATEEERESRARSLLASHGVDTNIDAAQVASASARFNAWLRETFGASRVYREWPIVHRQDTGTLANGTADLVVKTATGLVLVDHKTFPGTREQALARLGKHSGQLATYAQALAAASGMPVSEIWIHLPVLGLVVPVTLLA